MRSNMAQNMLIVTLAVCALSTGLTQTPADEPHVSAAKNRQDAIHSVEMTIQVSEEVAEGGWSAMSENKVRVPQPKSALKFSAVNRLVISRLTMRYDNNNHIGRLPNNKVIMNRMLCAFADGKSTVFYPDGLGTSCIAEAVVRTQGSIDGTPAYSLLPIWTMFRALTPAFCPYSLREARLGGASIDLDGAVCSEYVITPTPGSTVHFWLDKQRDFVPRRIATKRVGGFVNQFDIAYQPHARYGWLPVSWTQKQITPDGKVVQSVEMRFTDIRINEPVAAEKLEIRFPSGTQVQISEEYQHQDYVVREDGSMAEMDPRGTPSPRSRIWNDPVQVLLLGLFTVATVGLLVFLRCRSRSS